LGQTRAQRDLTRGGLTLTGAQHIAKHHFVNGIGLYSSRLNRGTRSDSADFGGGH
jgi:hypothetical protein